MRGYVTLSVDHKPNKTWAIMTNVDKDGWVTFTSGWDRFVEENNVADNKWCVFNWDNYPNHRVIQYHAFEGSQYSGEYEVDELEGSYKEGDEDENEDIADEDHNDTMIVEEDGGQGVEVLLGDVDGLPFSTCRIAKNAAVSNFVKIAAMLMV